ncbi:MAG: Hpt domain-containing protein [Bacteroidetes bacterium]|nr:Hpt domain-containing protein [Bacteroidota bacterium]
MLKQEKLYNTDTLIETHQADDEFLKLMITLFVKNMSESNSTLERACNDKNWQQVHLTAHKMKASIDLFNLHQLKELIRSVESRARHEKETETIPKDVSTINQYINDCIIDMKDDYKLK